MTLPPRQRLGLRRPPGPPPRITALVTAAPGWVARYQEEDGTLRSAQLCAWALMVNEDGSTFVTGIDPTGEDWDGSPAHDPYDFAFIPRSDPPRGRGGISAQSGMQHSALRRGAARPPKLTIKRQIGVGREGRGLPNPYAWPPHRGLGRGGR